MPAKRKISSRQPSEELLPITLTQNQREAMIHGTRLKAAIRRKIAEAGDSTQVITFTKKELDHMEKEIGTAAVFAPSPYKKHLVAAQKKVAEMVQKCQSSTDMNTAS